MKNGKNTIIWFLLIALAFILVLPEITAQARWGKKTTTTTTTTVPPAPTPPPGTPIVPGSPVYMSRVFGKGSKSQSLFVVVTNSKSQPVDVVIPAGAVWADQNKKQQDMAVLREIRFTVPEGAKDKAFQLEVYCTDIDLPPMSSIPELTGSKYEMKFESLEPPLSNLADAVKSLETKARELADHIKDTGNGLEVKDVNPADKSLILNFFDWKSSQGNIVGTVRAIDIQAAVWASKDKLTDEKLRVMVSANRGALPEKEIANDVKNMKVRINVILKAAGLPPYLTNIGFSKVK